MDPNATISIGVAFNHCFHTASYWIGIVVLITIAVVGNFVIMYEANKLDKDLLNAQKWWWIAFAFAIFFAIMHSPCDIAVNTTYAFAAKGEFIY